MLFYSRKWANLSSRATLCVPPISRYCRAKIAIFENFAKFMPKTGSLAVTALRNRFRRNLETTLHTYWGFLCTVGDFRRLPVLAHQRPECKKCGNRNKLFWRFLPSRVPNRSVRLKIFLSLEAPFQGLPTTEVWPEKPDTVFGKLRLCYTIAHRVIRFFAVFSR